MNYFITGVNQRFKSILGKAVDSLDITLAFLGCILSIPLIIYLQLTIRQPIFTTIGIISFLACLTYLLIRRKSLPSLKSTLESTPRFYLLLNILFFALLTYSIVVLYLRPDPYTRPLGYFISMAAMVAISAIEILFLPPRRAAVYLVLLKVIIIGLSLAWSTLLLFPSTVGSDLGYHQMFTTKMLDSGHIPEGYGYSALPCMHLLIGATSLVSGLDYRMAAMFSIGLLQVVCGVLFFFLLGKFIHSAKAGLLAALLLVIANYHIYYSYCAVPNTMAVILIPIIIYLLFKLRQERPIVSICLSALFMVVLILTHTLGAAALAMLLFLIWLGFEIYKRLHYHRPMASARIFIVVFIIFTGLMLGYWSFAKGPMHTLISLVQTQFSGQYFGDLPPGEISPGDLPPGEISPSVVTPEVAESLQVAIANYRYSMPFTEQLFNQLGLFLFFALAFIGIFVMLFKNIRNSHGFALIIGGVTVLVITFFGIILNLGIITCRWIYISQILLAIPLGVGFFWLSGLPKKKISNACLLGTMVFTLSFLIITGPYANMDNRSFSPNTIIRCALTESELSATDTSSKIWAGKIGIDAYSREYFVYLPHLEDRMQDMSEQIFTRDFSVCQDIFILIRREIVEHPYSAVSGGGTYRLSYDPRQALIKQGFSHVYDDGSVSGFVKVE
jgi:hypothetical protein